MRYLEILQERRAALITTRDSAIADAEAIAAAITDDSSEEARSAALADGDACIARASEASKDIVDIDARISELEAAAARSEAARNVPFQVNPGSAGDDPYDIDLRTAARTTDVMRDVEERARRAVEQDRDLTDEHRSRVDGLMRDRGVNRNGALSRHIVATGSLSYRSAWV